jgi:hypothetical protein
MRESRTPRIRPVSGKRASTAADLPLQAICSSENSPNGSDNFPPGYDPCRLLKSYRIFTDGLDLMSYQTLMTEAETGPETSEINKLARLTAREHFVTFCHRESLMDSLQRKF